MANGKASKSELTQTAEELTSKIASVQVAHRNQGDRVLAIESNFKQRADALDAGVNRLTEGLRTKVDISSLNVTAENIRQSVKSLETNTQNKLNQKLSLAEFEVRAGSIRQEILNATKDKADKTLVISEAGKIREEFSKMKVGGRNYAEDYDFSRSLWQYSQGDSSPQDWTILNGEYNGRLVQSVSLLAYLRCVGNQPIHQLFVADCIATLQYIFQSLSDVPT